MNRRQVITTVGHDRGGQMATGAAGVNEGSTRAILAAFLANLGIAIASPRFDDRCRILAADCRRVELAASR